MAIICERCGTRTSSMICTECGYINPDPKWEEMQKSNFEEKKQADSISVASAPKVVRKWRWTRFFGYFHTLSIANFSISTAFIGLSTLLYALMSLITTAFFDPNKNLFNSVLCFIFSLKTAKDQSLFYSTHLNLRFLAPLAYYILPILVGIVIFHLVFALFGLSMARNISCVGFSFYLKKKNINVDPSFIGEDVSASGMMLQDAAIMKERPLTILAFFGRLFGTLLFTPAIATLSTTLIGFSVFQLYRIILGALDGFDLYWPLIVIGCVIVMLVFPIVLFIVYKKVMGIIFDKKVYK